MEKNVKETPSTQTTHISPSEDIQIWQLELIQDILKALVYVGLPMVVLGAYSAYPADLWVIPIYLATYAILLAITFPPRVSYRIKVLVLLGLIYAMGALDLFTSGKNGDGRIFLLLFVFIATIAFNRRRGFIALGINALTMAAFTYYFSLQGEDASGWVSSTAVLIGVCVLLIMSPHRLVSRLSHALTRSQSLVQELETNQAQLTQQTNALQKREADLAQRNTQMQTILDVGRVSSSILDPDQLLKQAIDLICERLGHYFACVFVVDPEGNYAELRAGRGAVGQQLAESKFRLKVGSQSMVGWTAAHRQPRIAQDVSTEKVRVAHPLLQNTRAEITLPLIAGKRLVGVLDVQSARVDAFGEQEVAALRGLADQLAVGLENAQLFQETQKTLGKAEVLYEASQRLTQATTTGEVAEAIIASVAGTGVDGCVVIQFEYSTSSEPDALFYLGSWRRDRAPLFRPGLRLPMSKSPFPFKMISSLWVVTDVEKDETLPPNAREVFMATEARALVNIPLRTKEKVIGQVVVLRTMPGPFSDIARRLYEMLSDQAAVALERARLLEASRRRAEAETTLRIISDRVGRAMDTQAVLRTTAEELSRVLGAAGVYIELGTELVSEAKRQV
jgi:GAF domain-containing protein